MGDPDLECAVVHPIGMCKPAGIFQVLGSTCRVWRRTVTHPCCLMNDTSHTVHWGTENSDNWNVWLKRSVSKSRIVGRISNSHRFSFAPGVMGMKTGSLGPKRQIYVWCLAVGRSFHPRLFDFFRIGPTTWWS